MPIKKLNIDDWDFISDKEIISKLNELCDHINGEEKCICAGRNETTNPVSFVGGYSKNCPVHGEEKCGKIVNDIAVGTMACEYLKGKCPIHSKPQKEEKCECGFTGTAWEIACHSCPRNKYPTKQDQKITELENRLKIAVEALESIKRESSSARICVKAIDALNKLKP